MPQHSLRYREAEIEGIRHFFPAGSAVLELGGGSGFQASRISSWGCRVNSIDIAHPDLDDPPHFPVLLYDGFRIPFKSKAFDIVFSSNVLEHVRHLRSLLTEIRRVLKPGGIVIHVLPTPCWRFWTSITFFIDAIRRAYRTHSHSGPSGLVSKMTKPHNLRTLGLSLLLGAPHGEFPSAWSELFHFSRSRWSGVFRRSGFRVMMALPTGLCYTGNDAFPCIGLPARRSMARYLGSSTQVFVLRAEAAPTEPGTGVR